MSILEQELNKPDPNDKTPVKGSASHIELLGYLDNCFSLCQHNRQQFERQWYLNLAFYFGRQNINWSTAAPGPTARLVEPAAPKWRVRLISNQIRRYIRKEYSKAIQESPTGYVLPASGDDEDLMAAKAGDAIIEYLFRELKYKRELRWAVWWASMLGNGFLKDWYKMSKEGEDTLGDMPEVEAITPFHLYIPDVTVPNLEKQEYVIQVSGKSKHYVKQTYGKDVETQGQRSQSIMDEKFLDSMNVRERMTKDQVQIKEAWFKPNSKFEKGAVIVWANDEILFYEDVYPYEHGEYPFTKIDHIATGRFYNESIITDLIPLQKEYNRTRSQIIEAKNRTSKPGMYAPQGSIDTNKVTSEPGLIIEYKPGFDKPTERRPPEIPSYVLQEIDRVKGDMDDISSQHEVSRGQAPTGVEAATAISYLQEQDDSVLSDLIFSIEQATEKIGRHLLYHVNKNWEMERKIQVTGLNNQMEAFQYSKANLNGNTDYSVSAGSATPRSKAGKEAFIMNAMDKGYIQPAQGFKYLEMNETSRMFEEMQVDVRQAQRENLKMSQGIGLPEPQPELDPEDQALIQAGMMEPPPPPPPPTGFPVNTYDNDIAHIMEHDNWRKRQQFESSPDEIKALFEQHIMTHKLHLLSEYGIPVPPEATPEMIHGLAFRIMNNLPVFPMMPGQEAAPVGSSSGQPSTQ